MRGCLTDECIGTGHCDAILGFSSSQINQQEQDAFWLQIPGSLGFRQGVAPHPHMGPTALRGFENSEPDVHRARGSGLVPLRTSAVNSFPRHLSREPANSV